MNFDVPFWVVFFVCLGFFSGKERLRCESIVNCKESGTCIVCGKRICSVSASTDPRTFINRLKRCGSPILVYIQFRGGELDTHAVAGLKTNVAETNVFLTASTWCFPVELREPKTA